jgi:hypothetical protein
MTWQRALAGIRVQAWEIATFVAVVVLCVAAFLVVTRPVDTEARVGSLERRVDKIEETLETIQADQDDLEDLLTGVAGSLEELTDMLDRAAANAAEANG